MNKIPIIEQNKIVREWDTYSVTFTVTLFFYDWREFDVEICCQEG